MPGTRKGSARRSPHREWYALTGAAAIGRWSHAQGARAAVESAAMDKEIAAGGRRSGPEEARPVARPGPGLFLARVRAARRRAANSKPVSPRTARLKRAVLPAWSRTAVAPRLASELASGFCLTD